MMTIEMKRLGVAAALCGALLLTACEDDEGGGHDDAGQQHDSDAGEDAGHEHDAGSDAGGDPDASEPAPEPTYAIATQVFGPSEQTSYLVLHEGDLFGDAIDIEGGIERAGRALAVAGTASGSVFYAGDQRPEVDRYQVEEGALEEQDTVSFMSEGLMGIAEYAGQLVMLSDTKALYFDARTLKVIVWNPKDMTLTKAIGVSDLTVEGFSATFSTLAIQAEGKVFMPVGYRTPASVPSVAAMVVVDPANETASVVKDDRCGYVRDAVLGEDGMIYLATEAFGSAVHHLNSTAAPAPCLLRFDPESEEYDGGFQVDLNELAGGKTAGSLIALPNGKTYTRVLDESKVPEMEMPSGRALASARAWAWAELALGDEPELTEVEGHVMGGSFVPMPLGDKLVVPDFAADLSKTTLCDMTQGPTCDTSAEVDGLVFSVALVE